MSKKEDIQNDCEHCHSRYKSIFCQIAPDEVKIINENKWCQSLEKGQQLFAEGIPMLSPKINMQHSAPSLNCCQRP